MKDEPKNSNGIKLHLILRIIKNNIKVLENNILIN